MTTTSDLTFDDVSAVSRARAARWHPGFPDDTAWSGADWSNAMCGEAGEAANVVKKLRRHETGAALGPLDPDQAALRSMLADELADVFLYLDLLAAKYDIDLPASIVSKFNRVSERQGFPERLELKERTGPTDLDRLAAMNHAGAKLKVTIHSDSHADAVVVDCAAVMATEYDVPSWLLEHEGDGVWSHWQSGTSGPLYDMLRGIACSYTVEGDPDRAAAIRAGR